MIVDTLYSEHFLRKKKTIYPSWMFMIAIKKHAVFSAVSLVLLAACQTTPTQISTDTYDDPYINLFSDQQPENKAQREKAQQQVAQAEAEKLKTIQEPTRPARFTDSYMETFSDQYRDEEEEARAIATAQKQPEKNEPTHYDDPYINSFADQHVDNKRLADDKAIKQAKRAEKQKLAVVETKKKQKPAITTENYTSTHLGQTNTPEVQVYDDPYMNTFADQQPRKTAKKVTTISSYVGEWRSASGKKLAISANENNAYRIVLEKTKERWHGTGFESDNTVIAALQLTGKTQGAFITVRLAAQQLQATFKLPNGDIRWQESFSLR